jgi:uncharacterized membrane protein YoaK (UPF0700 family)
MTAPSPPQPVSTPALLCITATTGIVDAVSVLGLGHVFTANMTGNVVFLGFALSGSAGFSIARSLAALSLFLIGAALGGRLATSMVARSPRQWIATAFGIDGAAVLMAALSALVVPVRGELDSAEAYAVLALTAFAMGMRNATMRKLGTPDLTTTVLTLTITGLAADSSLAGGSNPRWLRRVASISSMFVGAAAGTALLRYSTALPLLLCGVVSIGCALSVYFRPVSQDSDNTPSTPVRT